MDPNSSLRQTQPKDITPVAEAMAVQDKKPETPPLSPSDEEDISKTCDRECTIALKYLEIARSEILERLKLSNQFLIVYLGGISALLGWIFATRASSTDGIVPLHVLPAVATGLSFLAFSLTWVLNENEDMIERLAKYQTQELGKVLRRYSSSPMWENSKFLRGEQPSEGAMSAHFLIINAPNIVLILASILFPSASTQLSYWRWFFIVVAIGLSYLSCLKSIRMIQRRTLHRGLVPTVT